MVKELDYPLQGQALDLPLTKVLAMDANERRKYINQLLGALGNVIKKDEFALKGRVSFSTEMRDLRKLLHTPADKYLYTDEESGRNRDTYKRNVFGKGSPGSTHTFWSRKQMWKMRTKGGDLKQDILSKNKRLVSNLDKLFDPTNQGKAGFRSNKKTAVRVALSYMEFDKGSGTAFPPFHAKYLADKYLPIDGDGIVVDPCAGWGGRLLGTLCVNRTGSVTYYGIDPEVRNKPAYDGLERRVNIWLAKELTGKRIAKIAYLPFEDWLKTKSAQILRGKVNLVFTSPPYFSAENYNPENKKQSANRYKGYDAWRNGFYKKLIRGAYQLLKPGGTFVLNIANVAEAPKLELDARALAREIGFENGGFYKLAMAMAPANRKAGNVRHSVTVNGKRFKHEPVFCFQKPL